jgi:hypothetical protein
MRPFFHRTSALLLLLASSCRGPAGSEFCGDFNLEVTPHSRYSRVEPPGTNAPLAAHSARTVVEDRVIGDPSGSIENAMPSFQVEPRVRDTEMTVSAFFPYCAPQSGPPCVAATSQLNFGPGKTSCTVDQRLLVALAGLEVLRPGLFLVLLCQRKIELR